jgi:hypothetical protein
MAVVLDTKESRSSGARGISFQLAEMARFGGPDLFVSGDGQHVDTLESKLNHSFARGNGAAKPISESPICCSRIARVCVLRLNLARS